MRRHHETLRDIPFAPLHILPDPLLIRVFVLPQQHACIHIRRARRLRVIEQRDDAQQDRFDTLDGAPALAGALAGHFVFAGRVQDRNAEFAIRVDVWVVEGPAELEGWRRVGVGCGEGHCGAEVAGVVEGGRVEDYECDGPGEDVFVDKLDEGSGRGRVSWYFEVR